MARIRSIKPEFWTDEKTGTLPDRAKCLFLGLLNHADDYGVIEFKPSEWRVKIFPYDSLSTHDSIIEPIVSYLLPRGLAVMFAVGPDQEQGGRQYFFITNFAKHQIINRPSKPLLQDWKINDTPETYAKRMKYSYQELGVQNLTDPSMPPHGALNEPSRSTHSGKERKGEEGRGREGSGAKRAGAHARTREALRVVEQFHAIRSELWPNDSRLYAETTLETQAQQFLDAGIGADLIAEVIDRVLRWRHGKGHGYPPRDLRYFARALDEAVHGGERGGGATTLAAGVVNGHPAGSGELVRGADEVTWRWRYGVWREKRFWSPMWGPNPDEPGCYMPSSYRETAAPAVEAKAG